MQTAHCIHRLSLLLLGSSVKIVLVATKSHSSIVHGLNNGCEIKQQEFVFEDTDGSLSSYHQHSRCQSSFRNFFNAPDQHSYSHLKSFRFDYRRGATQDNEPS